MVCATDRNLPNSAYFLLEDHPEKSTGYTFILSIIYTKIKDMLIDIFISKKGNDKKIIKTIIKANIGAIKN
jgi:uncharacterized membrane protein